jgi:hypothetical protein
MDAGWLVAIVVSVVALWAAFIVLLWLLRPRDVSARELVRVVPDLLRLLRSIITDSAAPLASPAVKDRNSRPTTKAPTERWVSTSITARAGCAWAGPADGR